MYNYLTSKRIYDIFTAIPESEKEPRMPRIGQLLGLIPADDKFEVGDWVTGTADEDLAIPKFEGRNFQVKAVRDIQCTCESVLGPFPPGAVHEPRCGLNGRSTQIITIVVDEEEQEYVNAYLGHILPPSET